MVSHSYVCHATEAEKQVALSEHNRQEIRRIYASRLRPEYGSRMAGLRAIAGRALELMLSIQMIVSEFLAERENGVFEGTPHEFEIGC